MDIGTLLICLALLIVVAFIVARPIVEGQGRGGREKAIGPASRLTAERESVLAALRDLDFDQATGKITDEDYAPQRAALVAQGAAVLRQLDALGRDGHGQVEDEIERAVARRRKSRSAMNRGELIEAEVQAHRRASASGGATCPACGTAARAGDRFCPKCGRALSATCPECGQPAGAEDRFCSKCGAKIKPVEAAR